MRIRRFLLGGHERWGIDDGAAIRVTDGLPDRRDAAGSRGAILSEGEREAVRLLPPLDPTSKVLCVGHNYRAHIRELGREEPTHPVIFPRFPDSLVADGEPMIAPRASSQFDYEGELAVVIGTPGRDIGRDAALDHVLGYTLLNDGSVRDFQRHSPQFTPGKNFPRSGALGPSITVPDDPREPFDAMLRTTLNGEVVQESSVADLLFDIPELIAYCSQWTTLRPGDVIATGTPGGVGAAATPPRWLVPGDVVSISLDNLEPLTNPIAAEFRPGEDDHDR
ncbi:MAG: fumarylacetoacetate hydrolase family protein [Actinomycetales bacterium]|nr:fumarylacetoacetate hydrolase family protein [Actinomycetales bacterium]